MAIVSIKCKMCPLQTKSGTRGKEVLKKKDKTVYAQNHFSMYAGKEIIVTLLCGNNMVNVIVDCFGRGIHMLKVDGDYFSVKVDVAVNGNFLD